MKKSAKRTGDVMELDMCKRFLDYDYEVFKNVSCTGPVDFITLDKRTGEVTLYDSKTPNVYNTKDGKTTICTSSTTELQKRLGVQIITMYNGYVYYNKERVKKVVK